MYASNKTSHETFRKNTPMLIEKNQTDKQKTRQTDKNTNKHLLEKPVVNASAEGTPILVKTKSSTNLHTVNLKTKLETEW